MYALWLIGVVLPFLGYWFLKKRCQYWALRGVAQSKTQGVTSFIQVMTRQKHLLDFLQENYNDFPNLRYVGTYEFLTPTLIIKDIELIKQITVKDFDHFTDHKELIPVESDPLFSGMLFSLTGQKWRDMRSTLSPAFTGSKMRLMFNLMLQNSNQFVEHFLKQNQEVVTVELKDSFTRFANDVIASAAFGVECDSLANPNTEFYLMGKDATNFTVGSIFKFFGFMLIPKIYKFLNIRVFSGKVSNFFLDLVKNNISQREKDSIIRPDMIHLLMEARKNSLKPEKSPEKDTGFATVLESAPSGTPKSTITDEDITAQALIFFFAGFETVSTLMCFAAYELAVNQEIQEKLYQEVQSSTLTYDGLLSMKYLDMIISESLRKWPPAFMQDRVCTKPYVIEPQRPLERPVRLDKNMAINFPVFGIHRDPKYYPDPEKFDPERFSEERKSEIEPFSFLPFGSGPRNCIGSRFALLETKAILANIVKHFQIVPVEKSQIPLVLSKKSFNLVSENGFWFGFKRRQPMNHSRELCLNK